MKEGQGFARIVTLENLETFASLLRRPPEADSRKAPKTPPREEPEADQALASAQALFSGNPVQLPLSPRTVAPRRRRPKARVAADVASPERGPLLWEKKGLPRSDVQRQRGNPTGGVRLVQAGWKVGGRPIDQTIDFRETVFGNLSWTVDQQEPNKREVATVPVDVSILGESYGRRQLRVTDMQSREAGQGNYTTMLHWGNLGEKVRQLNLIGKTFRLYAPRVGEDAPFFIEIT